jgi:hypothetical protein
MKRFEGPLNIAKLLSFQHCGAITAPIACNALHLNKRDNQSAAIAEIEISRTSARSKATTMKQTNRRVEKEAIHGNLRRN